MDLKNIKRIPFTELKRRVIRFNDRRYIHGTKAHWDEVVKDAAVLILLKPVPLTEGGTEWHVLMTVRSHELRTHAGEVAFPGGFKETHDESLIATALREASEEVGLSASSVQVLSVLPPFRTRYNVAICPVVAVLDQTKQTFHPKLNTAEVETTFWLPLHRFLDNQGHSIQRLGPLTTHCFEDDINSETYITWGITSLLCVLVSVLVHEHKPMFTFPLVFVSDPAAITEMQWNEVIELILQNAMNVHRKPAKM